MLDVVVILTRLQTQTTYTVVLSTVKEPTLQDIATLPIIYVGYGGIKNSSPGQQMGSDLFNQFGQNLSQTFEVQIICKQVDLSSIWKKVYTALVGYTPTMTLSSTASTSGMEYVEGGVLGIVNDRLWHLDRWAIEFPTTNVDFSTW